MFIAKSIERIGDHSKNISEYRGLHAKGRDVRHIGLEGSSGKWPAESYRLPPDPLPAEGGD